MTTFTPTYAAAIEAGNLKATKNPRPVSLLQQTAEFQVQLSSGAIQTGQAGDYVAYDPISGQVFLVTAAYYTANYTPVPPPTS
jgi:hypothetical protein